MYEEQQLYNDLLYVMLYGGVTFLSVVACIYLQFRRGNAFAPEITPPLRLRRWVVLFFALMAVGHVWWLLLTIYQVISDPYIASFVGVGLDSLVLLPVMMVMLLAMLQDRCRPTWHIAVMMIPVFVIIVVSISFRTYVLLPWLKAYFLLFGIAFVIAMLYAVRQYSRWLRENYADLEHKEVWQSLVAIIVCMLILGFYIISGNGSFFAYFIQVNDIVLICLLLWRVETLQTLDDTSSQVASYEELAPMSAMALSTVLTSNIGLLLEQRCEATHLYLRHDIRLDDFCKIIGTNRNYLNQYFTQQQMTYNTYINNLRIEHFVRLYREAVAAKRSFTAQQLAQESGFRSYSTFSSAFKQRMKQTVTSWMRDLNE